MKSIYLDTNFLIYCAKFKIDLFSEIERICDFQYKIKVLESSVKELQKLKPANFGLIKKFLEKIEIVPSQEDYADKELKIISNKDNIVVTQDKELKDSLKGPVIIIRQKKYLQLINR